MAFEDQLQVERSTASSNEQLEDQCLIETMSNKPKKVAQQGVSQRTVRLRHSGTKEYDDQDHVANEVPVAFAYNGNSHAVMMASPVDLYDFAVGFSITESVIDSIDDILDIDIRHAHQGITIQLDIPDHLVERMEARQRKFSGRSGCGICGITDIAAALPTLESLSESDIPCHDIIQQATMTLLENQVMQRDCGGVHCAGLFDSNGKLLAIREDVGRHNALDKLIGAQIGKIKPDYFVFMSSRASHELIIKTAKANIGTLVSISAATGLAIDVAESLNINLIGFIRGNKQIIYTSNSS